MQKMKIKKVQRTPQVVGRCVPISPVEVARPEESEGR